MTKESQLQRFEKLGFLERERGSDRWLLTPQGEDFIRYMSNWLIKLYEWIPEKYTQALMEATLEKASEEKT